MSDSKNTQGEDSRLAKSGADAARGDRATADESRTQNDGTSFTKEERLRMMRAEWVQEVLPTPPHLDGYHCCWLSTTNSADPIYKRVQKGYEPVKVSEVPGFAQYKVNQGEFEGCVACNEMILFKLPNELYQAYMAYVHHELPNEEEEMLRSNATSGVKGQDSDGRELGSAEGFDSLARRNSRTPHFH